MTATLTRPKSPTVAPARSRPKAATVTAAPRTWVGALRPLLNWTSLLAVLAVGAYLCLWNIGLTNENVDERVYVDAGWAYLNGDMTLNLEHPPTAKYLYGIAQVLFGQGLLAPRIVAGSLTVTTGLVLWLWLRPEMGWLKALIPTLLWMVVPRGNDDAVVRLDRYALLEPVMVFFVVAACAAAWRWYRTGKWWWIAASGVLMGAAVTSKVSAAFVLAAFLVLLFAKRRWYLQLRDVAIFSGALAVTFVGLYTPVNMVEAISYMLEMQAEHNEVGHMVNVAGIVTTHPDWWANLWYTVIGMGWPVVAALTFGIGVAFVAARQKALVVFLLVALAAMLGFHMFGSKVALAHYYTGWLWLLTALGGIGIAALFDKANKPVVGALGSALGIIAIVVIGYVASVIGQFVWADRPRGTALVQEALATDPAPDGDIFVAGLNSWAYNPYFPDQAKTDPTQINTYDVRAIVIGEDDRFGTDPMIEEFLASNPDGVHLVELDDADLFILDGKLQIIDSRAVLVP